MGMDLATNAGPIGSGSSGSESPARELARRIGLDIRRVEHVDSAGKIRGRDNTLYVATDDIGKIDVGRVHDTAIVGQDGADVSLTIDRRDRSWDVLAEGSNFVFANIDLDQRKPGAWGRVHAHGDGMWVRNLQTIGKARPANPDPSRPIQVTSGPTWSLVAPSPNAVNGLVNVTDKHGGVLADRHFGDRPMGMWYGASHKGTVRIVNSELSEYPNNGLYATAAPGSIEAIDSRFWNNGVTAGRFSHGFWKRCDIGYDHENSGLGNADAENHGTVGIGVEQKKDGVTGESGPDIIDCTVRMKNVAKGGAGIRAYDIYKPAKIGDILRTDIHIERGCGDYAADMEIAGKVGEIKACELSGSNRQFASVHNTSGRTVTLDNTEWSYGGGRNRSKAGRVRWP